jgi:hypothetical protein
MMADSEEAAVAITTEMDDDLVVSEGSSTLRQMLSSSSSPPTSATASTSKVQYILLVDFHHKKGPIVEYSYPALPDATQTAPKLPAAWSHLPSLALPDALHNQQNDTTFFTLPALTDPQKLWFGVSCAQQINSAELNEPGEHVTRNTVMKALVIVATLPLFNLIEASVKPTIHVIFKQQDFFQQDIYASLYKSLNRYVSSNSLLMLFLHAVYSTYLTVINRLQQVPE